MGGLVAFENYKKNARKNREKKGLEIIEDVKASMINQIAFKIYQSIIDQNSHIDWYGFNYLCEINNVQESEFYLSEAMVLIKKTVSDYYENQRKKEEKKNKNGYLSKERNNAALSNERPESKSIGR